VLSWLLSLGRCTRCGARIPARYALSELALAVLFALSALTLGFTLQLAVFSLALVILTFIVLYDIRHMVVPMPAASLLVAVSALFAYLVQPPALLAGTLIVGGLIGLAFFLLFALSRGRAMGLGDSPVALALSLLVGNAAFPGLLFSFWIGALCGIAILVGKPRGHRMGIEVPFVPFLAAGFLLAYFTQWTPFLF
jgi:leader peptidase (prepilin peptidase)/N-methyltransferase